MTEKKTTKDAHEKSKNIDFDEIKKKHDAKLNHVKHQNLVKK